MATRTEDERAAASADREAEYARAQAEASARPEEDDGAVRDPEGPEPPSPPRQKRRPKTRPQSNARPSVDDMVASVLSMGYGLAGQAVSMWAPPPERARQSLGMSMAITAIPAGRGAQRILKRTPIYPFIAMAAGGIGALDAAAPLGIPLLVGMYGYAPAEAKERLRPMVGSLLGMALLSTYGPEPPAPPEPGDMTPLAMPDWIKELVAGLLPPPDEAEPVDDPNPRTA